MIGLQVMPSSIMFIAQMTALNVRENIKLLPKVKWVDRRNVCFTENNVKLTIYFQAHIGLYRPTILK